MLARRLIAATVAAAFAFTPALGADQIPQTGLRVITGRLNTDSGSYPYQAEVAETKAQQRIGMQGRVEVPQGTGMWFPFARAKKICFWMRDTFVPLDMIFVSTNGTVEKAVTRTDLDSDHATCSRRPVIGVLEVGAGQAARIGLQPGNFVIFPQ